MKLSINLMFFSLVVLLTVGIANAADVKKDMVSYWPLDGNAKDIVGGFDGKEMGSPKWVQAHKGQGVQLDGVSHINAAKFELFTDVITFVAWINGWKMADWAGIVGSRTPTACEMIFGANDTVHYVWNNNAATTYDWAGAPQIPQDSWAMVALTVDPEKATAYVYTEDKGIKQSANKIPHVEQQIGNMNIGFVDCCGNVRYFKGIIDEVMIYKRALTEADLLQLAFNGLAVESSEKLATTWGDVKR